MVSVRKRYSGFFKGTDRGRSLHHIGRRRSLQPCPLHEFLRYYIIFFGEGEDILPDLLAMIVENSRIGLTKEEILLRAVKSWDCLYVPRFYEERFTQSGTYTGTYPLRPDVREGSGQILRLH